MLERERAKMIRYQYQDQVLQQKKIHPGAFRHLLAEICLEMRRDLS
jgi:hypothetical protein